MGRENEGIIIPLAPHLYFLLLLTVLVNFMRSESTFGTFQESTKRSKKLQSWFISRKVKQKNK